MKKMNLKKLTFMFVLINIFFFLGLNYYKIVSPQIQVEANEEVNVQSNADRDVYLNIMTTNKYLYNMCKDIIGDKHNLSLMFSDCNEMKNFNFTQNSINSVSKMDIFLYMGLGNEPWADKFIENLKKGKVGIVDLSRGIKVINRSKSTSPQEKDNIPNEYYWISPEEHKIALYNLKSAIEEKDIKNKDIYEKQYNNIIKDIDNKKDKLKKGVQSFKGKSVVLFGDNLEYLINGIGINYNKISVDSSEDKLKELLKQTDKDNGIIILDNSEKTDALTKVLNEYKNIKVLALNTEIKDSYTKYLQEIINSIQNLKLD